MTQSETEFLEELRRDFVPEAEEYLQTIVSGLLDLEKGTSSPKTIEDVFRAAHSLKGAAQAVQMPAISSLCQVMESVFSGMKKGTLHPGRDAYDSVQRAADVLASMLAASGRDDPRSPQVRKELESLLGAPGSPRGAAFPFPGIRRERDATHADEPERKGGATGVFFAPPLEEQGPSSAAQPEARPEPQPDSQPERAPAATAVPGRPAAQDTVRIAAGKLDDLFLKAEELVPLNQILGARFEEVREIRILLSKWRDEWRKARNALHEAGAGGRLSPAVAGFLDGGRNRLEELRERAGTLERALAADRHATEGLVGNLLESARTVLMLPCSTLLQGFPKIVRDLARDLGKEAELTTAGGDIEVDKRILEGLKDPLVHLIRNAVDHGLEKPEERRSKGKPPTGTLSLSVSSVDGGRVQVLLTDDGGGIDAERVRESAVRAGLLSRDEALSLDDDAARMLIFRSGVSTSPIITAISGRGLGMAIVSEGVEALGGAVAVTSVPGRGTTFAISLPLTLAAFRGVLVEERSRLFVIPTANVRRVTRIRRSDIRRVENRETVSLDGVPLALVRLGALLGLPPRRDAPEGKTLSVVATGSGAVTVALVVDRVVSEREVLLKPLGRQLRRVRNIAGVTIPGSGDIIPVLNCADLVISARRASGPAIASAPAGESGRKRVIVAEDSITSRTLLKNILNAAGYDVRIAVDGMEAWEMIAAQEPDIVVSDVEMPRMNGFDLTAKIRSEERFAGLPVVLVTSLESAEDKERGVAAGADAYIVKGGFDQGALIEVIRRLL